MGAFFLILAHFHSEEVGWRDENRVLNEKCKDPLLIPCSERALITPFPPSDR